MDRGAYYERMADSVFCLAPPGWAPWSPRIVEAAFLGCIPVIVTPPSSSDNHDSILLPFDNHLNYKGFSLRVSSDVVFAGRLLAVLEAVAAEPRRIARMRAALVEARDAFRIDDFGASTTSTGILFGNSRDGDDDDSNEPSPATNVKVKERRRTARKGWGGNDLVDDNLSDTGIFYGLLLEELRQRQQDAARL
eukprot:jgi/Bigna1/141101/aug1.60_g15809